MANKSLGYVLSGVGLIVLLSGFSAVKTFLAGFIPVLSSINNLYLYIVGGVLILAGLYFVSMNPRMRQVREVPIYQGRNIVGYRKQ